MSEPIVIPGTQSHAGIEEVRGQLDAKIAELDASINLPMQLTAQETFGILKALYYLQRGAGSSADEAG